MSVGDDLLEILRPLGWIPANVYVGWQIAKSIYKWDAERRARRPPPKAIIEHRARIRDEIVGRLRLPRREDAAPAAPPEYRSIRIRDMRDAPQVKADDPEEIGSAPAAAFKVHGLYHHGIEVVLPHVRKAVQIEWELDTGRDKWRFLNQRERPEDAIDAVPYGRIPFDYIEIDWGGVEEYGTPTFLCRYDSPFGDPYAAIIYRAEWWDSDPHRFVDLRGLRHERDEWSLIWRLWFLLTLHARRLFRSFRNARTK